MEPLNRGGRIYIKDRYPLSGLLFCAHCGRRMGAHPKLRTYKGEDSKVRNIHMQSLHKVRPRRLEQRDLRPSFDSRLSASCLGFWISSRKCILAPAQRVDRKAHYEVKRPNRPEGQRRGTVAGRVDELDRQANRLITAIRKTDDGGLVQTGSRQGQSGSGQERTGRHQATGQPQSPKDRGRTCSQLTREDFPRAHDEGQGLLREVLRRFVAKIECRWGRRTGKPSYPLLEVRIQVRRYRFAHNDRGADRGHIRGHCGRIGQVPCKHRGRAGRLRRRAC